MVEIAQIFNNNSALVNLGNQKQAIVKGKGIAFNKSKGSNLDTNKIEKLFYLNRQITSLIRTSPESFNGSLLMMYF